MDDVLIRSWLHGRPATTAAAYRRDIAQLLQAAGKPLAELTLPDLQAWADSLTPLAPASIRRKLAAARSLLRYAAEMGAIPANPAVHLRLGPADQVGPERILSAEQVARLIGAEPNGRRRTLLRLLYICGLRASEAAALSRRDLTVRGKGGELAVLGKGAKRRTVGVPPALTRELLALHCGTDPAMLALHRGADRADAPLIPGRDGGQLNRAAVHRAVKRAGKRIGLPDVSAHWLRHCHVSHSLDRGAPVHLVRQTVGHSDLRTTSKYSHSRGGDSSANYLDTQR